MRFALSLLALFAVAAAAALLAGNNQGTITLYWPPYRVDLSLNLVLLLVLAAFVMLHLALRALAGLFAIPHEAKRWRLQHKERAMHLALLESLSHLIAGRFIRARKSAELALAQEAVIERGGEHLPYAARARAVSHWMVAESAHALHNRELRDAQLGLALEQTLRRDAQETREGVQMRAAQWALDDRDAPAALRWLDGLPHGAARRTVALRLALKAARLADQTQRALETARLLAKHGAFSAEAGHTLVQGLELQLIDHARDPAQVQQVWASLDARSRANAVVAIHAAGLLQSLGGELTLARQWLLPAWERLAQSPKDLPEAVRVGLIACLERGFAMPGGAPDQAWLARIESAHMRHPGDASLQYLAGIACMHLQLWGKAQALLTTAMTQLQGGALAQSAWLSLAKLAEQRGDKDAAQSAYRNAAIPVQNHP